MIGTLPGYDQPVIHRSSPTPIQSLTLSAMWAAQTALVPLVGTWIRVTGTQSHEVQVYVGYRSILSEVRATQTQYFGATEMLDST